MIDRPSKALSLRAHYRVVEQFAPLAVQKNRTRVTLIKKLLFFVTVLALVSGWLNERRAGGSILPGFALHAAGNLTTYLGLALAVI